MVKDNSDKPFPIPNSVLNSINECSQAFVLCTVDNLGNLSVHHRADNEALFLAMIQELTHFTTAVNITSTEMMRENMMGEEEPEEE